MSSFRFLTVSTKAIVHFHIDSADWLPEEARKRLHETVSENPSHFALWCDRANDRDFWHHPIFTVRNADQQERWACYCLRPVPLSTTKPRRGQEAAFRGGRKAWQSHMTACTITHWPPFFLPCTNSSALMHREQKKRPAPKRKSA